MRSGKRAIRLLEHPRFRAAYDFLLLRAQSGEAVEELAEWWSLYQDADEGERRRMSDALRGSGGGGRRGRPRKRRRSGRRRSADKGREES